MNARKCNLRKGGTTRTMAVLGKVGGNAVPRAGKGREIAAERAAGDP